MTILVCTHCRKAHHSSQQASHSQTQQVAAQEGREGLAPRRQPASYERRHQLTWELKQHLHTNSACQAVRALFCQQVRARQETEAMLLCRLVSNIGVA